MSKVIVSLKFLKDFSKVRPVVSQNQDLSNPTRSTTVSTSNQIAKITMDGLSPNTQYYYGVEISGILQQNGRGQFKTFPVGTSNFTCAFGSCAFTGSGSWVFVYIREVNPLFFIHMGDLHYEDINVNDINRFRQAYDRVFVSQTQSALYANVPTMYVFDDHDFGGNDSDGTAASKPAAQAAYRERVPHYPLPASNGAIYQSWVCGRVRFIMTDLDSNSSPVNAADNSSKTKLGEEQIQWFFNELKKPEPLKVWVNSKPWIGAAANGTDKWWSYSTERRRIANFIKANNLEGRVLIISGDMHGIAIDNGTNSDYADGGGANIPVFQAAPLNQNQSVKGGPYSNGTFTDGNVGEQFGVMNVTDNGGDTITVQWIGRRQNTTVVTHTMTVPGTPYTG